MCKSIANGGRRCKSSLIGNSNYPHLASVKNGTWTYDKEKLFSNTPALVNTFIIASRSNSEIPTEISEYLKSNVSLWDSLETKERWAFWKDIADLDNPSSTLKNLHTLGWEQNFPALANVRDVPQDPIWHPEGHVHEHIQQAADVAAINATRDNLSQEERQLAVLGALCHDFGKSTHTQISEEGKISSLGHDMAGYDISQDFLKSIGASKRVVKGIPWLVREHMCHVNKNPSRKSFRKIEEKLKKGDMTMTHLARIIDADTGGRGEASNQEVGKLWVELKKKYDAEEETKINTPAIDSSILKSLNLTPGPQYSQIIRAYKETGLQLNSQDLHQWVVNYCKGRNDLKYNS